MQYLSSHVLLVALLDRLWAPEGGHWVAGHGHWASGMSLTIELLRLTSTLSWCKEC